MTLMSVSIEIGKNFTELIASLKRKVDCISINTPQRASDLFRRWLLSAWTIANIYFHYMPGAQIVTFCHCPI